MLANLWQSVVKRIVGPGHRSGGLVEPPQDAVDQLVADLKKRGTNVNPSPCYLKPPYPPGAPKPLRMCPIKFAGTCPRQRDPRDIHSDPDGKLIHSKDQPLKAANMSRNPKPVAKYKIGDVLIVDAKYMEQKKFTVNCFSWNVESQHWVYSGPNFTSPGIQERWPEHFLSLALKESTDDAPTNAVTMSVQLLNQAKATQEERAKQYNSPEGERSMGKIVDAFNAVTGHKLTTAQGWLFMVVLKLVRDQAAGGHEDSCLDAVSYVSLYGEASLERKSAGAASLADMSPREISQLLKEDNTGQQIKAVVTDEENDDHPKSYLNSATDEENDDHPKSYLNSATDALIEDHHAASEDHEAVKQALRDAGFFERNVTRIHKMIATEYGRPGSPHDPEVAQQRRRASVTLNTMLSGQSFGCDDAQYLMKVLRQVFSQEDADGIYNALVDTRNRVRAKSKTPAEINARRELMSRSALALKEVIGSWMTTLVIGFAVTGKDERCKLADVPDHKIDEVIGAVTAIQKFRSRHNF